MNVTIRFTNSLGSGWTMDTTRAVLAEFKRRVLVTYPRAAVDIIEGCGHRRQFLMLVDEKTQGLTYDPGTATPDEQAIARIWNNLIGESSD